MVRNRELVSDVGERRGARADIVGNVEQRGNKRFIGRDAFALDSFAATAERQAFGHKTAFGTDRHDDRVLDVLRLDQAKHLSAEILRPIRPAYAAAGDFAKAQMHGFEPRRIDEYLI